MIKWLMLLWLAIREHLPKRVRGDDIAEPLSVARCPVCKSTRIYPTVTGTLDTDKIVLWNCMHCQYEFDPMQRVRDRERIIQSWREVQ